jgi:hypothetical protein
MWSVRSVVGRQQGDLRSTSGTRGLSLKVSDEFTVPLCAIHHHHIHTTGKEREWWQERNIDPLKIANALWQNSREQDPAVREADQSTDRESERAAATQALPAPDAIPDAVRKISSTDLREE